MAGIVFYASTTIKAASVSGANRILGANPFITIHNVSRSTTGVSIQTFYWNHSNTAVPNCTFVWTQTASPQYIGGNGINIISFGDVAASACKVTDGRELFTSTPAQLRPSSISTNSTTSPLVETINGELVILPGYSISLEAIGTTSPLQGSTITVVWQEFPNGLISTTGQAVPVQPLLVSQQLNGVQDSQNKIFTTNDKFISNASYRELLFINGIIQVVAVDYYVFESEGPGTGYDSIMFINAPLDSDSLTISYYKAS